jgi:hypothetical protein
MGSRPACRTHPKTFSTFLSIFAPANWVTWSSRAMSKSWAPPTEGRRTSSFWVRKGGADHGNIVEIKRLSATAFK